MKFPLTFSLLVMPSLAFAQSPDHAFYRAFERAAQSAVDRGATLSPSVKERDKETAKAAFQIVARHYESNGYDRSSAERIAVEKTARAYADIKATSPKHETEGAIDRETLVMYLKALSRITVKSSPTGASVSINGQPCGKTETCKWLRDGDYSIIVSLQGYKTQQQSIHPKGGEPETVALTLER